MTRFDYLWRKFCERTPENTDLNHLLLAHQFEEELERERLVTEKFQRNFREDFQRNWRAVRGS